MLEDLSIPECNNVTSNAVRTLLQNCAELRHLDLRDCFQVTDEAFTKVQLQHLQTISLENNPR
jgi:hypothetical protein